MKPKKDIIKICSNNKFQKMMTVNANRAIKASHRRMRKRGILLVKKHEKRGMILIKRRKK